MPNNNSSNNSNHIEIMCQQIKLQDTRPSNTTHSFIFSADLLGLLSTPPPPLHTPLTNNHFPRTLSLPASLPSANTKHNNYIKTR